MDAERGHRPARRLLWGRAPGIAGHKQAGGGVLLAIAMRNRAEGAARHARLELAHAGMEAPRIGDAERNPGPRHRIDRRGGAFPLEGERLFHEDVLAGGGGPLDLAAMLAV